MSEKRLMLALVSDMRRQAAIASASGLLLLPASIFMKLAPRPLALNSPPSKRAESINPSSDCKHPHRSWRGRWIRGFCREQRKQVGDGGLSNCERRGAPRAIE